MARQMPRGGRQFEWPLLSELPPERTAHFGDFDVSHSAYSQSGPAECLGATRCNTQARARSATVQDTTDRAAPPAPFDRPPGRRNLGPREGKALALSFWPRPPAPPGAPGAPAAQSAQRRLRAAPRFASDPVALHRPPPPPPREASHGRTKGSSLAGMVLGLRFVVFPGLAVAGKLVTKAASSRLGVPGG